MFSRSNLHQWRDSPLRLLGGGAAFALLLALVWAGRWWAMPPTAPAASCRSTPALPAPAASVPPARLTSDFATLPTGLASTSLPRAHYLLDNEAYLIDNQQPHSTASSLLPLPYEPTAIAVAATLVAGNRDTASGIIFGYQPDTSHYHLRLSYNGLYRLDYVTPERTTAVLDWTPLPTQQQWQTQPLPRPAHLELRFSGQVLAVLVDEMLLERLTLPHPHNGQVGLATSTFGGGGAICFDNLVIA